MQDIFHPCGLFVSRHRTTSKHMWCMSGSCLLYDIFESFKYHHSPPCFHYSQQTECPKPNRPNFTQVWKTGFGRSQRFDTIAVAWFNTDHILKTNYGIFLPIPSKDDLKHNELRQIPTTTCGQISEPNRLESAKSTDKEMREMGAQWEL